MPLRTATSIALEVCSPQKQVGRLEALDTNMIILNASPADGADSVSPVVMAKLIKNQESLLVIYGKVSIGIAEIN